MKSKNNVVKFAKTETKQIKKEYDEEIKKEIEKLKQEILDTNGPVDSVKLRQFLDMTGLNEAAKEYKKVLPVFLINIETVMKKNMLLPGTIDNIKKLIAEETGKKLENLSKEGIIRYVKDNNLDGMVILQTKKDGTFDFYAPGKSVLKNDYEFISDDKREKYMEKINPELKKYLKEKNIDIDKLPIVYKKNPVLMITIEDIKSKFPEIADKLLKDGIVVEHWGNIVQEIDNKGYFVFNNETIKTENDEEQEIQNAYTVGPDTNGYPIGYEPANNTDSRYKLEI